MPGQIYNRKTHSASSRRPGHPTQLGSPGPGSPSKPGPSQALYHYLLLLHPPRALAPFLSHKSRQILVDLPLPAAPADAVVAVREHPEPEPPHLPRGEHVQQVRAVRVVHIVVPAPVRQ